MCAVAPKWRVDREEAARDGGARCYVGRPEGRCSFSPGSGGRLDLEFIRSTRGRWIGAGIAVGLAAVVALWVSLPGMIESRVRDQLARRGLTWKSADQTLRWRGVR